MFLEQYWGGPTTYSQQRGHPRLRMRHAPFAIGAAERDAWLRNMRAAVDSLELTPEQDATLDRKSTRLNSSHANISYAVFCLKKKKNLYLHITPTLTTSSPTD